MKFKLLVFFILLVSFIVQPLSYATPTLTIDFCSSGFQVVIAPTTEGIIYVSTGLYALEPISTGECIPIYDPTTQRAHFYFANSTDAYYIGWYYEYGYQNKTLFDILKRMGRNTTPALGTYNGDSVIFSFANTTYRVPVDELTPYLWRKDFLDNLVAFSCDGAIVIVPAVKIDVVERNFTVIRKSGKRVGTTLLDFNFTYKLSYQYPLYLNGTVDGRFEWRDGKEERLVTLEELLRMFDKPLYIFYFDGESLKRYPLLKIEILMNLERFKLAPQYEFENLAPLYLATSSSQPLITKQLTSSNFSINPSTSHALKGAEKDTIGITLLLFAGIMIILAVFLWKKRKQS